MRAFIVVILFLVFEGLYPFKHSLATVNPNQVYTSERLSKDIQDIHRMYHNETELKIIGKTHFGQPIWAIKLGKGNTNLLFIGAHHGREWLTSTLLMSMLEQYAKSYHNRQRYGPFSTEVLNEVSIWFVPMLNPDGVAIQQKGIQTVPLQYQKDLFIMNAFSPDFSKWKANGKGIDLNRQYPSGWDKLRKGPFVPWYQFYKGKHPFEAMEAKALSSFTEQVMPSVALSYHSSGREIFWKGINKRDQLKKHRTLAKKVSALTKYPLSTPEPHAIGGGFTDWFISTYQNPAMTVEISYPVEETNPPLSVFPEEWNRNKYVGIMLATEIAREIRLDKDK